MKKLLFLLVCSTAFADSTDSNLATINKIDQFIDHEMQVGQVPGLELVAIRDGQVIYAKGYGYVDVDANRPMTPNTPLVIGSTTKAMTALAIMQLVEGGKLELDKKVIDYLPWFKMDGQSNQITIRELLNHTAGIPTGLDPSDYQGNDALEHRVRELASLKMDRLPGTGFEYANDGYTLAGLLIEKISGMSYETYMDKNIFQPLMMNNTRFFDPTIAKDSDLIQGYAAVGDKLLPKKTKDLVVAKSIAPAGLAISNVMDISNYLKMWLDGGIFDKNRVISIDSIGEIWKKSVQVDGQSSYGFGWYLSEDNGLKIINHPGGAEVISSEFILIPEKKIAVAVLVNRNNVVTTNIAKGAIAILLGQEPVLDQIKSQVGHSNFKPDVNILQKYVGDYDTQQGLVKVFIRDGELYAALGGEFDTEIGLEAISNDRFIMDTTIPEANGQELSFTIDDSGKVNMLFKGSLFGIKR